MDSKNEHIVIIDFPRIKKYVFGTDRLVEIRGASAMLDELNRRVIPAEILRRFPDSRCVYAGGGAGQFIIIEQREQIKNFINEICGKINGLSGGSLRLAVGIAPMKGSYGEAVRQAFREMEMDKRDPQSDMLPGIHCGYIRECDSCSGMASERARYADEERLLCTSCSRKEQKGRERGLWEDFATYIERTHPGSDDVHAQRPTDFEEIGERCTTRRGYTALVYGDGNAMGRIVRKIVSEEQFKVFSSAVDEAVRDACYSALTKYCTEVEGKRPADILLLGGDDLIVYLAADTAMPFAVEVTRRFQDLTRERLFTDKTDLFGEVIGETGLTMSFGIAYGRSHTPIDILIDQAEELLKSAKRLGSNLVESDGAPKACIDFHMTSRYNQVSIGDSRRHHLSYSTRSGEEVRVFGGPYTLEETELLLEHSRKLAVRSIPTSRLHRLGEAPFAGKIQAMIETMTITGRSKAEHRDAIRDALIAFDCFDAAPWRELDGRSSTVLVDLMQLVEFTKTESYDANG